jgi:prepilin-type N-terminal cleavage/methylation domain-containing protein
MGRKTNAFTLVELLIVLAIVGILAVIALMYLRGQIFKSNDATRKADLDRINIALEEYEKDHNCYPLPHLVNCNPGTGLRPYLEKIPCDPITHASYYYEYEDSTCPTWYRLYTNLDNPDDASAMPFCGPLNSFNYYVSSPNAPACTPVAGGTGDGGTGDGGTGGGTGGGDGTIEVDGLYGCFSGVCQPINWDPSRPGPVCDPHYSGSNCYGACLNNEGQPVNSCTPWQ